MAGAGVVSFVSAVLSELQDHVGTEKKDGVGQFPSSPAHAIDNLACRIICPLLV